MTTPIPERRWFHLTPDGFVIGLLVMEGLLWLSERYTWFGFNEKKGWTVLIAVAVVGGAFLATLLWFTIALLFRWRFQFSIRSLLVLVAVVALPFSWLAVEMKKAREQEETVRWIFSVGGVVYYDWQATSMMFWQPSDKSSDPEWLLSLLGVDFFHNVDEVWLCYSNLTAAELEHIKNADEAFSKVTPAELEHIEGLKGVRLLKLRGTQCTDAAIKHLIGFTQLELLWLDNTEITDSGLERLQALHELRDLRVTSPNITNAGVKKLQQALPNCKIMF